ncbi:hypothetical protein [Aurantiacibacter sediminis]|uniref:PepSY domain-containing protein n=1 Tax=Aurantiacibacter sediminis TaxID=2793064 RepID=A0ABS0N2N5_9SPHN|nr:hypothetical protein [Aurantiacibacter sediminis]MBH5322219.1 hypothetical protein [Aurantiacibacter sediminis]
MTFKHSKFASPAALAAALSLVATPASAVELPLPSGNAAQVETGAAAEQSHHHRWRRYDRRHRNRVDAGDVIAGVVVLGTIAAIAGVFDGDDDRRDRRNRDWDRDRDYDNRDYRGDRYESGGIERAADMCVEQVERGRDRVSDVLEANRRADGWYVSGTLEAGGSWNCWIDNDGRIRNIDFGASAFPASDYAAGQRAPVPSAGEQWDDSAYARARANTRTPGDDAYTYRNPEAPIVQASAQQPDYPGGPLPGEEGLGEAPDYGEIDGDLD